MNDLTQKEKEIIHQRVEKMTPQERRNRLKGFVNEYIVKNIIVHAILLCYVFGLVYLNENYEINNFVCAVFMGIGVFWIRVCLEFYKSYVFFKSAKNLAESLGSGLQNGIDYLNQNCCEN